MNDTPQPTPRNEFDELSKKIENVKKSLTDKCDSLQKEIDVLKGSITKWDDSCNSRLERITSLIGSTMDHIQLIVHTVTGMHQRVAECEDRLNKHGSSLAINKKNLLELNKYVKKVDSLWKTAQKEVDALNAESDKHKKFRNSITAAISAFVGTVTYFGWDFIKKIFCTLTGQ